MDRPPSSDGTLRRPSQSESDGSGPSRHSRQHLLTFNLSLYNDITMADDTRDTKPGEVDAALGDMKLEEGKLRNGTGDSIIVNGRSKNASTYERIKKSRSSTPATMESRSQSPKRQSRSATPKPELEEDEECIAGGITVTVEPGKVPRLSRKSTQKIVSRPPPLFNDMPDVTDDVASIFQRIKDCIYGSKHMGSSEHDALDCDCSEEWSRCSFPSPNLGVLTDFR